MKIIQRIPKLYWTMHVKRKMRYYALSENRVKSVMRKPDRREFGIAPNTIAVMQKTGTKKNPTEIWSMYQDVISKRKKTTKVISAWRYPGVSPKGKLPEIPEDTLLELKRMGLND